MVLVAWLLQEHEVPPTPSAVALALTAALGTLAWSVPGVMLALTCALVGLRSRQVQLVGLSGAFLVLYGIWFYYQLELTLALKGALLVGTGAVLLAGRAYLQSCTGGRRDAHLGTGVGQTLLACGGLALTATVLVTQVSQQERALALGEPLYLELAPVDPRSLIQGDYMALEYQLARDIAGTRGQHRFDHAVVTVDDRGVATLAGLSPATSLDSDDRLIHYHQAGRRVRIASQAWLFQEGLAETYARARYGEVVLHDGETVLVGLRDAELEPLGPPRRRW